MGYLDIIFIILFAGGAIIGYRKGALKQLGSFAGVLAGIIACNSAGEWAAGIAAHLLGADDPAASAFTVYSAKVIGYGALFGITWLGVWLVAGFLRKATHALMLGPVDSVAGAVFLIFKWFLVVSLLLNFWKVISPESPLFSASRLGGGVVLEWVMSLAPACLGFLKSLATNAAGCLF